MADTISILSELRSNYDCSNEAEEPYFRALTKGIEAIKVVQQEIDYWRDKCAMYEQAVEMATVEHKGHWINRNGDNIYPFWERYKCSVCGGNSNNSDYCPNCGTKMENE